MTIPPAPSAGVGGTGYDLEALSAYADRGRMPPVAEIDQSPECQAVLDSIDRLGALGRDLLDEEADRQPPPDESWIQSLLESISREVRAGRDIPFPPEADGATVAMTEGAIREVIRAAGDSVPGVLVGRVRADIDPERAARIAVTVSVVFRRPLASTAEEVRAAVDEDLRRLTPILPVAIDVTVDDVHLPTAREVRS